MSVLLFVMQKFGKYAGRLENINVYINILFKM